MQTVYSYLNEALVNSHIDIPWRLTYVSVARQVVLQTYLPVETLEPVTFLDKSNQIIADIDYLELKFVFTEDQQSDTANEGVYVIQPIENDHFVIGYLEVLVNQVSQVLYDGRLQIKELLAGERLEIDIVWPKETVEEMVKTRKDVNRYDNTVLELGDDKNDLV